jgi:stage II sporulation protein M
MIRRLNELLSRHIKENIGVYFTVTLFFAIGISIGAFTVKALDDVQKQALIKYLQGFFQILTSKKVDSLVVLKQSAKNNLQTVFVLWILGITVIGIPITLLIIGIRGFIIGFTVGFLLDGLGIKGFFFTILAILPQNLIIIPCIIGISVISVNFSVMLIKDRLAKRWTRNYWEKFFSYSLFIVVVLGISVCGSLIEAYITPIFIKLLSSYLAA